MTEQEKIMRDVMEMMRPRERNSIEFLERMAIIEEGCKVTLIEAYLLAHKQGVR